MDQSRGTQPSNVFDFVFAEGQGSVGWGPLVSRMLEEIYFVALLDLRRVYATFEIWALSAELLSHGV